MLASVIARAVPDEQARYRMVARLIATLAVGQRVPDVLSELIGHALPSGGHVGTVLLSRAGLGMNISAVFVGRGGVYRFPYDYTRNRPAKGQN